MAIGAAGAPAKLDARQDFAKLLLDLSELEREISLVAAGLGGIPLCQHAENASLAKVAQIVDVGGRSAPDVGIDRVPPVQVEACFLGLGVERGDYELDAR